MNIFPINNSNYNTRAQLKNEKQTCRYSKFDLKMTQPLKADTVSFGAKMAVLIEDAAARTNEKLKSTATVYMDVLESIATKLKPLGVIFDRDYCEPNAIKSSKSIVSKVKRSSSFKITDRIRGTLYCKNLYDPSILINNIIPELEKRGYVIAKEEKPLTEAIERGYQPKMGDYKKGFANLPDVDMRLSGISKKRDQFPSHLKHIAGEPENSGYEDIQLRLVPKRKQKRCFA